MMLAASTLTRVDEYWADFFGCTPGELRSERPVVVPHATELADYRGIYLQSFGGAPVASLPHDLRERYAGIIATVASWGLQADDRWQRLPGLALAAVIGPAWIGYADAGTLRAPPAHGQVRSLAAADKREIVALRDACSAGEWEQAGSPEEKAGHAGAFDGGVLAALAGYEVWGDRIAHLYVVTHPARRGRGHGRAAIHHAAAEAMARGLVPQYRTLLSNEPSRAVAAALGFEPYATSLALRL
jgi:ribosomal protein S18 acetylase RimI-like enzyme